MYNINSIMLSTLTFKVGKFYELYHTDAVIGVKELNLIFMKVEQDNHIRHSDYQCR